MTLAPSQHHSSGFVCLIDRKSLRFPPEHGRSDPGHQQAAGCVQHGGSGHHPAAADSGGRHSGKAPHMRMVM